jgi:lipopolysaccharide export system ATP-binding protein
MPEHQLKAIQLSKSYNGRKVVSDFTLEVSSGQVIGLLGPNGAGKTTSFYMLIGLIKPDYGQCYLDDTQITQLPMYARARLGIGYLPQEPSVFRKMTAADNIRAILQLDKKLSKKQINERTDELLQQLHITHIANNIGMSLSGGERRRVEIARSLASNPKFLLLDEPFAGIDPLSIEDIRQIILNLAKSGIGILITDHNVREALSICDKATIFHQGNMIAFGTDEEIISNQLVRDHYLGEKFEYTSIMPKPENTTIHYSNKQGE